VYIIFKDHNPHTMQFTVTNSETGREYIKAPRGEHVALTRSGSWSGHSFWFQIAGRLPPGKYFLNLTIDDQAAGKYPFAVVSESPQR
jgi:hypothetical protein